MGLALWEEDYGVVRGTPHPQIQNVYLILESMRDLKFNCKDSLKITSVRANMQNLSNKGVKIRVH